MRDCTCPHCGKCVNAKPWVQRPIPMGGPYSVPWPPYQYGPLWQWTGDDVTGNGISITNNTEDAGTRPARALGFDEASISYRWDTGGAGNFNA